MLVELCLPRVFRVSFVSIPTSIVANLTSYSLVLTGLLARENDVRQEANEDEEEMSKKLFVGSLDWNVTDADLNQAFSAYGNLIEAKVIMDRDSGRSRGFGFVTLEDESQAGTAIQEMDGKELSGRAIRVNEANERPSGNRGPRDNNRQSDRW